MGKKRKVPKESSPNDSHPTSQTMSPEEFDKFLGFDRPFKQLKREAIKLGLIEFPGEEEEPEKQGV